MTSRHRQVNRPFLIKNFYGDNHQFANYLNSLGAILVFDGQKTNDQTKIRNFGTSGNVLDGTPTNITINANGMFFNGTDSIIVVASDVPLQTWSTGTFFGEFNPTNAGEGSSGVFYSWGNTINEFRYSSSSTYISREDTDNNDARDDTTTVAPNNQSMILFRNYDHTGDKKIRIYEIISNTVTEFAYSLQSAATGNLIAKSGNFNIGNRTLQDRTFSGVIKWCAWINRVLTNNEMMLIAKKRGY